ncbi:MAG: ABC transporter substrate-binding protein [Sarcina sp.]
MKKLTILLLSTMLSVGALVGCSGETDINNEVNDIKLVHSIEFTLPRGTISLAMSDLISDDTETDIAINDAHKIYNLEYQIANSTEVLMTSVMKGEPDIAIVPSNIALKAYNKDLPYKLLGTVGFGSLYLISTNGDESFENIKGQEVFGVGKGLTPDIVFRALLDKKGIKENEIKFSYVGGATELAPAILSGKAKYAVVPEPVLSVIMAKNKDIKIIASLNDIWKEEFKSEKGFPQSSIIVRNELAKNDELMNKLIEKIDLSVDEVNKNPKLAAKKEVESGSTFEEAILESSITRAEIDFVKASESIEDYKAYYKILNDLSPESIGGKLPNDEFFYEK